ncbi:CHAT domain-containing protein [Aquimarina sp. MAR_2010_214]|uniref:CHAT domain-containing protein n=1 Tax=Aquimarina sp. MAR_2010_214 TaxID=1250026 RepID=UPI000C7040A4|nr:tetratricopeptide repeat protein [Aquimarina sp. MAR_2010_214]PKV48179.1 CHAT domain-containing protein [Aquimarina sp. MAR_2010_214]
MTITIKSVQQQNTLLYLTKCLLFLYTAFGYAQTVIDTTVASQHFSKADTLLTARKLDSAVVYFKKALPIYQKANAWERVARCYNKISEGQRRNATYDKSYKNAQRGLEICKVYLPEHNREKAYGYDNIGDYYYWKNKDYKKGLEYYQKSLAVREEVLSKDHLDMANSYIDMGNIFFMRQDYNKALAYYQKSLIIRKKQLGMHHVEISDSCFNIGLVYDRKEEYDIALLYLNKSLSIQVNHSNKNWKEIAKPFKVIGDVYRKKGNYNKGLSYYKEYLKILIGVFGENHFKIVYAFNKIGIIYQYKGEYDIALHYYNRAIDIKNKISKADEKYNNPMYNNIGIVYKYKGEYEKALIYLKKALRRNLKVKGENHPFVPLNYNNIGNIYRLKGEYDQSLLYYKKALSIRTKLFDQNNSQIAESYNDIGELYTLKMEYDKALYYANKALKIRTAIFGLNNPFVADSYTSLGNIYFDNEEPSKAMDNYQNTLTIRQKIFGKQHPKVALSYNDIAKVYATQKEFTTSLTYYDKAVLANTISNVQTRATFKPKQYLNLDILITSLLGKAKTYTALYKESNDIDDLNSAIQTYQNADVLINTIRQSYTNYQDKVRFAQKAAAVYQGAIGAQLLLYNIEKERSSLEKAFYYAEKSKANTLKELLADANAKHFTGLPANLVALEKELRIDKAFYQSKITASYDLKASNKDSLKMTRYENKLFDINTRQDSLIKVLEKNYPKYYQLKHENTIVTVRDIQHHLNDSTTLLEFFTSDSLTYAFTISKDKIAVQELQTPNLKGSIEQLREAIISQNLAKYKTLGYSLYNTLIAPIANTCIGDELIIIPDGPLWHLNFELLLTQKDTANNPPDLSYLLKEYAITYANAANLLFAKDKSEQPIQKRQECLAFSFSDSTITTNTMSLATLRDTGIDLPGTRKEIKAISNIIDGQYYYGSQAIEANFKKNAGQYAILHLALHGDVDNERPEHSKLYFTKSKDTIEDNLLYSHELFALDIPAELTVLSACHTGTGKIAKGEGIMSLGSAFQYAGTKSLLLSSWEVSDQTTPELMQYFYTNLKAGMNKAKALQQAKLQYLATANINRTQPFYWGGFYLVGDSSPILFENDTLLYWIFGVLIVLVFAGLFWYRRKKN